MLLLAKLVGFDLELNGFTFQKSELETVPRVLRRHEIPYSDIDLHPDQVGRIGRGWSIPERGVNKLETELQIKFLRYGEEVFAFPVKAGGKEYCCREITFSGDGDGRETINADDSDDALFKCALVAGRKHWLGGSATRGRCRWWLPR
jgi:hypothetical protein